MGKYRELCIDLAKLYTDCLWGFTIVNVSCDFNCEHPYVKMKYQHRGMDKSEVIEIFTRPKRPLDLIHSISGMLCMNIDLSKSDVYIEDLSEFLNGLRKLIHKYTKEDIIDIFAELGDDEFDRVIYLEYKTGTIVRFTTMDSFIKSNPLCFISSIIGRVYDMSFII